MSYAAVLDNGDSEDVGTIGGWPEFRKSVPSSLSELRRLVDTGESRELGLLLKDTLKMQGNGSSDALVKLLRRRKDATSVVVSDGIGEDDEAEFALSLSYSPDQPRDERGEWTSGGGPSVQSVVNLQHRINSAKSNKERQSLQVEKQRHIEALQEKHGAELHGMLTQAYKEHNELQRIANEPVQHSSLSEVKSDSSVDFSHGPAPSSASVEWTGKLSGSKQEMLSEWSEHLYEDIRDAEKTGHDPDKLLSKWNSTLNSAPKFEGVVYRGVNTDRRPDYYAKFEKIGAVVKMEATSSASKNPEHTASEFAKDKMLWRVRAKSGVDIEHASSALFKKNEKEVLLRKGSKYRVTQVAKNVRVNGTQVKTVVTLEEV